MMRRLDPWRYLLQEDIVSDLWGHIEEGKRGETIVKPEINAVTDTLVAITSSKEPTIAIRQTNTMRDKAANTANLNERIGHGFFHEVNKYRDESLLSEGPEWMFHRGKMVMKILWLSPEERGEVRSTTPAIRAVDAEAQLTDEGQEIDEPGILPLYMTFIDPLECFYTIHPTTRLLTSMIHEYHDTWDSIIEMFPEIEDNDDFKLEGRRHALNTPVKVIDYWDREVNAVMVDGKFIKEPTEHGYPWVPFVVQAGRMRNRAQQGGLSFREAVPFCDPMYKSVRDLSWALSVLATYMKRIGFATLKHTGLPSDGASPWFSARRDATTGAIEDIDYRFELDQSPDGDVAPMFFDRQTGVKEDLEYVRPPDMVTHWQAFAAERGADVEIVSFGRAFLSGVMTADLSGYSVSLQRQLSMARIEPYILGLNRGFSRALQMVFDLIGQELEREGRADIPLVIQGLVDEPDMEITADMAKNVRVVDFHLRPDRGLVMQEVQTGLLSPVAAIDALGRVQDARSEWENIIFQQEALSNPILRLAISRKKSLENGYISEGDQFDIQLQQQQEAMQQQRAQQQQMEQEMTAMVAAGQQPPTNGTGP